MKYFLENENYTISIGNEKISLSSDEIFNYLDIEKFKKIKNENFIDDKSLYPSIIYIHTHLRDEILNNSITSILIFLYFYRNNDYLERSENPKLFVLNVVSRLAKLEKNKSMIEYVKFLVENVDILVFMLKNNFSLEKEKKELTEKTVDNSNVYIFIFSIIILIIIIYVFIKIKNTTV